MKPVISKAHNTAGLKGEALAYDLPKIDNKQAVSHVRHCGPDGKAVNWYTLEDGSEIMVDDAGKTVNKWPGE